MMIRAGYCPVDHASYLSCYSAGIESDLRTNNNELNMMAHKLREKMVTRTPIIPTVTIKQSRQVHVVMSPPD